MLYLKGQYKGQLKTPSIRKLVKLHNELSKIKIPPRSTREEIIKLVEDSGYTIDHANEKLVRTESKEPKSITLQEAETKFPKKSRAKKVDAPVVDTDIPKSKKINKIKAVVSEAEPEPAPVPAPAPAPAQSESVAFQVKTTQRMKLANAFNNKYDKTIYQVLKPYGITSAASAKKLSPAELKKISRKIRLQQHPDKGGTAEDFDLFNNAIKVLLDTAIVKSGTPVQPSEPEPEVAVVKSKAPEPEPEPEQKDDFNKNFKEYKKIIKPKIVLAKQAKTIKEITSIFNEIVKAQRIFANEKNEGNLDLLEDINDDLIKEKNKLINKIPEVRVVDLTDSSKVVITSEKQLQEFIKKMTKYKLQLQKEMPDGAKTQKVEDYVDIKLPKIEKEFMKKVKKP